MKREPDETAILFSGSKSRVTLKRGRKGYPNEGGAAIRLIPSAFGSPDPGRGGQSQRRTNRAAAPVFALERQLHQLVKFVEDSDIFLSFDVNATASVPADLLSPKSSAEDAVRGAVNQKLARK